MGGGTWSKETYRAAASTRSATGRSAFDYSDSGATTTHTTMKVNLDGKGADRESRDSDGHPQSVPIVIGLDETGSMSLVPRKMMDKLPALLGLLLRKGYVTDPQIMFAAIGDAFSDRAPLQVSQFESDNRMDQHLGRIYLEGNGGGSSQESYELFLYFLARHTHTDAWDKRGQKGYAFIIGDEQAYGYVSAGQVKEHIGDTLEGNIPIDVILGEVQERYEVFFIMPNHTHHWGSPVIETFWRDRLGQNFIKLEDLDSVCETIALTIGLNEGTVTLDAGLADAEESGASRAVVGSALATLGASARGGVATVPAPGDLDTPSGNERL